MSRRFLSLLSRVGLALVAYAGAPAQASDFRDLLFDTRPVSSRGPLSIGGYVGALYTNEFTRIVTGPTRLHFEPSYLVAANVDYRLFKIRALPIVVEAEFNVAKRFGQQSEFDFSAAPFFRWTWFPWNSFVYTNFRLGLVGLSYATSISPYERYNSGNLIGSNVLHFLVPEITIAPSETSQWEAFVRVHHRSGVFGLFNGVRGGSNYLSVGARVFL